MKRQGFAKQKWVAKFMSGWCATGKMMQRWNKHVTSSCPRCNFPVEDVDHVLKCQAVGEVDKWKESICNVQAWLESNSSCPDLAKLVINVLTSFKLNKSIEIHENVIFDAAHKVYNAQSKIGWRLFLDGILSVEWAEAQQTYLTWIGSRRSGKKWVAGLILHLWNVQWDAWMHRNEVLHDTPLAEVLSGGLYLDQALKYEWAAGFNLLPRDVTATLPKKVEYVLKSSLSEKKGWLVLIRRARESVGETCLQDEFSKSKSKLRKWVGL